MAGIGDAAPGRSNQAQAVATFDGCDYSLADERTAAALTRRFVDPVHERLLDLNVHSHVPKLAQTAQVARKRD